MLSDFTKGPPFEKRKEELWENNGWFFRGTGGDEEFLIWSAMYLMRDHRQWFCFDGAHSFNQTLVIHGHFSVKEKERMHDNDFVVSGVHNPYPSSNALSITNHGGSTSWRLVHRIVEVMHTVY